MVLHRTGNILDSGADLICHQVNCQGKMNSGVAKAIREKYPKVYTEYSQLMHLEMLGHIQVVYLGEEDGRDRGVINMFAQYTYGYDGRRYTSYDAFWNCLGEIKQYITPGKTLAFPARIGCVRGGANWTVIQTMIVTALANDYTIEFWDYDKG